MQDPKPENITGAKKHVFEHRIDWSWVLAALAVIYVTWKLSGSFLEERDNTQDTDTRHQEVME